MVGGVHFEGARSLADIIPEQVPQGWDEAARFYDLHVASFTAKFARDAMDLVGVTTGQRVIDVAAGSGALAMAAAQRGAEVLATDFSRGMVELLREKAERLGLSNLRAEVMDGQALAVPDASFERAFSVLGLIFFPDRKRGFAELARVLVPGGKAAVVAWSKPERMTVLGAFQNALWRALPDLALPPRPPPWLPLTEREVFKREMLDGGFAHVRTHTVSHVLVFDHPRTAFEWLTGATPALNVLIRRLDAADREALQQCFIEDVEAAQGSGPYGFEAEAHIAVGRK
jgi:ubiquinone/menaquinone biosynthesis C-methylase UbiE